MFYLSWSEDFQSHLVCSLTSNPQHQVYGTLEGLSIVFASHNGQPILDYLDGLFSSNISVIKKVRNHRHSRSYRSTDFLRYTRYFLVE